MSNHFILLSCDPQPGIDIRSFTDWHKEYTYA